MQCYQEVYTIWNFFLLIDFVKTIIAIVAACLTTKNMTDESYHVASCINQILHVTKT
jgi:hypothetical protein